MKYKHEIIALDGTTSEIAHQLDRRSEEGWEVVNVFHHSDPGRFIPLGDIVPSHLFALLRKQV